MNFTMESANQNWKQNKTRYLGAVAGLGAALSAAGLFAGATFDAIAPASTANKAELHPITVPVESVDSSSLTYYLVDTRMEANNLWATISTDQLLVEPGSESSDTYAIIVADSPEAERSLEELTSAVWRSELAANLKVVDLRSVPSWSGDSPVEPSIKVQ